MELTSFTTSDALHFARLRVRYRGPALRRSQLAPVSFTGWPDGGAALLDDDPSTCVAPTNREGTIAYTPQISPDVVGYELLAAVHRTPDALSGTPEARMWRGTASNGEAFLLGPNHANGARERFMSGNTQDHGFLLTFDRDLLDEQAPKKHRLCHVDYRVLTLPEQLDVVAEDGSRARFTKIDGEWQAAPGVRDDLAPLPQPSVGFVLTRPDGRELTFGRLATSGAYQLTLVSDPQGRSLGLTYDASDRLEKVTWLKSPAPLPAQREALTFSYAGSYLDFVEDWTGRRWEYTVDAAGDLIEARDPLEVANGWPGIKYQYTARETNQELNHNLARITFPKDVDGVLGGDRWIAFEYFNSDRVASHVDSLGNRQTFLFNVPRQESQTTDARGFTTVYRHDLKGNLLQRVDPDGATWTWEYDAERNVVAETDPLGRVRRFEGFDARGNPARMIDRDGRTVDYTYDPVSGAPKTVVDKRGNLRSVAFTSDGLPERVAATVSGVADVTLVTNVYDPTSRVLRDTAQPYGDGTGRIGGARYDYFPGNRDVRSIERGSYSCSPACTLTSVQSATVFAYDALGRPSSESITRATAPDDPTPITLTTAYQYDLRDRLLRVTRPDGTARVASYDRNGNLEVEYLEEPRPSGPPLQHERVIYRYDAVDRLVEVEDALGGITRYAYDAAGNRIAMTDPEGHTARVEHDALNRPVRAIDPNGAATTTEYDRLAQVSAVTDATGVRTTRAYDATGSLVALQLAEQPAATRERCYSDTPGCQGPVAAGGYAEEITDPNGNRSVYAFDELGRVTRHSDATPQQGVTQMTYDLRGLLRQVIDPEGAIRSFDVDALGRATSAKPPFATAPELTQYDTTGNPVRVTRPDGCQLLQAYDAMGRLVRRWTGGAPACLASGRAIDDRFAYDARGLLIAAANAQIGLLRDYDALGRLTRETDDRFGTSVAYQHDAASRLTAKVYPDGSLLHVAYDAAGRPVGITDPTGDTTRYVYDPAGRRVQTRSTTSSLRAELAYDALGRLDSIASFRADGTARPLVRYPAYDPAGNRLAMQDDLGTTGYAYDALHRLVTADPPGVPDDSDAIHYAYDRAGNRTGSGAQDAGGQWTAPSQTYTYEPPGASGPTHRLLEVRETGGAPLEAFVYDANGNPGIWAHPGLRFLAWDTLHRLVSITGLFSASYVYDPLGRRIEKTEGGQTLRYQYDGLDVVAEYAVDAGGASTLAATYVFGPGIDEPLKIKRGATLAAYHGDGLGSILAVSSITTSSSTDLLTYRYDAFGGIQSTTGSLDSTYTYTGRELDLSGLYYYRARYYLPSTGRFLSPDPIGLAGGLNPYAYVGSNPVNYTDPFGLSAVRGSSAIAINTASPTDFPAFSRESPYRGVQYADAGNIATYARPVSQSVTGTFGVPVVPGAGSVRTELFIAAETTLGGLLAGDARGFDAAPNPSSSRAFFTLDFESGTGAYQINPSCAAGGGSCSSALPIGAGNAFNTSISGNSITVTGSLKNSKIIGPSIDFGIKFSARSSGVAFSGYRNLYPSYEITRGSTFLYRGAETHPLRLFDATGFIRFSGP